ncbi:DNA-binding protein [Marinomonas arenicola]|uniref:DNA-binding protein n=1 Tax=Marinomonas arenicola TaxID=569601 RepID=UPI00311F98AB
MNSIKDLISSIEGGVPFAAAVCRVSDRAVYKWIKRNRLPRTEYSNETSYAKKLEVASKGKVLASDLLQQTKHKQTA